MSDILFNILTRHIKVLMGYLRQVNDIVRSISLLDGEIAGSEGKSIFTEPLGKACIRIS